MEVVTSSHENLSWTSNMCSASAFRTGTVINYLSTLLIVSVIILIINNMSRLQLSSDFCDPDRVSALGDFLLSSYGPRASAKAFVGSGGHLSLTATSQRILRSLELSDACCEAVLAAVRAHLEEHRDGGLLSGILVCQLTRLLRPLSPPLAGASAGTLRQIFRSCLLRNRCHLDWGQARHVLALARSVLSSKPWLRPREVESLSLSLARGFLNTIPERAMDDGHYRQLLKTKVIHGRGDEHRLVSGFIYRYVVVALLFSERYYI